MHLEAISVALLWGAVSGYLLLRILHSLLAVCICLHGLVPARWPRLALKSTPRQVGYGLIFGLLVRYGVYILLFGYLLKAGDYWSRHRWDFSYSQTEGLLWALTAGITAAFFFSTTWRRLVMTWKLTHEFGYAERREKDLRLEAQRHTQAAKRTIRKRRC